MNIEQALETIKELKYKLSTTTTTMTNDISNLQFKLDKANDTIIELNKELRYKDDIIDKIISTVKTSKGTVGILTDGRLMSIHKAAQYIKSKNPDKEYDVISKEIKRIVKGKRKAGKLYGIRVGM